MIDDGCARKERIPRQDRECSVAGMNDAMQAIGELISRKGLRDCRSMRQKRVACPCVGLSFPPLMKILASCVPVGNAFGARELFIQLSD